MNVGQTFLIVNAAIFLVCASVIALVAIARLNRARVDARTKLMLEPYRRALITMAAGEDEDGQAKAALCAAPAPIWSRLRPAVVAFLPKVRGLPAANLSEVLQAHGEIAKATKRLTSRSAARRARAAYLFGLNRDPRSTAVLLPLLHDPSPDVRLVVARALGAIGDPSAANGILEALGTHRGRTGLPEWVVSEALLAMGVEIGPVLQIGLASKDPAVRNVCAVVAGHGIYLSAAPQLRVLLAADSDRAVRASAAVALGRIGGADDAVTLARHADACEPSVLRRTCVTALGDLGVAESLETLAGLLGDSDRRLAELAADSLVRIGTEGIARLEMVANTMRGPGAFAALEALEIAGLRGRPAVNATGS